MKKSVRWLMLLTGPGLVLAACTGPYSKGSRASVGEDRSPSPSGAVDADDDDDSDGDEEEQEIALDQVPANVREAALNAVPGLVITKCEREREGAVTVYSLEGTANGERCEVEVAADGTVTEIERGDDEDDR